MNPLFAFSLFEITPLGILCLVGWAIAGVAVGKLLYRDDRKLRELQRDMDDLGTELSALGFTLIPPLLRDLAFLDVVQLRADIRHTIKTLRDPVKRRADFAKLLEGLLKDETKNLDTRQSFLDGVVQLFAGAGVKPSGGPGTDAIGNRLDLAALADKSVAFGTPVTVHVHNSGDAPQPTAPAPETAASK